MKDYNFTTHYCLFVCLFLLFCLFIKHNFVKTLKEIGKPEFPDQLALALHQVRQADKQRN